MKAQNISVLHAALFAGALLGVSATLAETPRIEATATTTTSAGTITEFGDQSITVRTQKGAQPIRYLSNETTNYVDENGNPVSLATVKSGLPVTVFYTKVGDTLVASKVMVRTDEASSARRSESSKTDDIVPDKVVIERVPSGENATPLTDSERLRSTENVTGFNKSGLAPDNVVDGFIMSNGRVYTVSRGQAVPLTQEVAFRITPSGFVGFNGQLLGLPEGAMFNSSGLLVAAPTGLRDVNGNAFVMRSVNRGASTGTGSTANSTTAGTSTARGNANASQASATGNFTGSGLEFVPLESPFFPNSVTTPANPTATSRTTVGPAQSPNASSTSRTSQPQMSQSKTGRTQSTQSQTTQPQTNQPQGTTQPQTTQPQTTQPQSTQPQSTQPQTNQPQSTTRPQTTQPGATQPQSTTSPQAPAPGPSGDAGAKQR